MYRRFFFLFKNMILISLELYLLYCTMKCINVDIIHINNIIPTTNYLIFKSNEKIKQKQVTLKTQKKLANN